MGNVQKKILSMLSDEVMKPSLLAKKIGISTQALHRHLKVLLENQLIQKNGSGPHVSYSLCSDLEEGRIEESFIFCQEEILPFYIKKHSSLIKKYIKQYSGQRNSHIKNNKLDFGFMLESSAVYSSNIEGNSMNLNSFLNSRLTPQKHRPKEAQEIEDLIEAYHLCKKKALKEKNMLQAHGIISKQFVRKTRCGVYRNEPVGVFSEHSLEYMAVEPHLVGKEMKVLFQIIQELLNTKNHAVEVIFWASWVHLMIVLIHPFSDGNGRTARLCEKWFLFEQLGDQVFFFPSEKTYFQKRSQYYEALKLGVNYWEVDLRRSSDFFDLLPQSLVNIENI